MNYDNDDGDDDDDDDANDDDGDDDDDDEYDDDEYSKFTYILLPPSILPAYQGFSLLQMKDNDASRQNIIIHTNQMRHLGVYYNAIGTRASTHTPDGQVRVL